MLISKFFPNPVGKDTEGEFIELFNDSASQINLSGWKLKDASGKTFVFKNQIIRADEHLQLDYKTTKITLNNDAETIFLYDSSGNLIDKAEFSGPAPEGKIFSRENTQLNALEAAEITPNNSSTIINTSINSTGLLIGLFIALTLASLSIFILRKIDYENL